MLIHLNRIFLLLYNKQSWYCVGSGLWQSHEELFSTVVKWKFITTSQICEMSCPRWTDKQRVNAFTICSLENLQRWLKAVESGGPGPRGALTSCISKPVLCSLQTNVLNLTTKKRDQTKWLNHFTNISRYVIRIVRHDHKSNWNQPRMIK